MTKLLKTLFVFFYAFGSQLSTAQNVQFKIELLKDGVTYQVSMLPSTTWQAPNNNTLGAQITLVAPSGGGEVTQVNPINGDWKALPVIVAPAENTQKDYLVIYLTESTALPFKSNVETPLFTFQQEKRVPGQLVALVNNNIDPFMPPNSLNLNIGNYITTRGGGGSSNNLWTMNK
jgi:hypothetical protein